MINYLQFNDLITLINISIILISLQASTPFESTLRPKLSTVDFQKYVSYIKVL